MIIWAHTVHLALRSPFKNNMVGGCGAYIKELVPAYYSLATGTAEEPMVARATGLIQSLIQCNSINCLV